MAAIPCGASAAVAAIRAAVMTAVRVNSAPARPSLRSRCAEADHSTARTASSTKNSQSPQISAAARPRPSCSTKRPSAQLQKIRCAVAQVAASRSSGAAMMRWLTPFSVSDFRMSAAASAAAAMPIAAASMLRATAITTSRRDALAAASEAP